MEIDHYAVVMAVKAHVLSKRSHGQDELMRVIAQAELDHRVPEGEEGFDDRPSRSSRSAPHLPLSVVGDPDGH